MDVKKTCVPFFLYNKKAGAWGEELYFSYDIMSGLIPVTIVCNPFFYTSVLKNYSFLLIM